MAKKQPNENGGNPLYVDPHRPPTPLEIILKWLGFPDPEA